MGGSWTPGTKEIIPGIYTNFTEAAIAAITGGQRGVVAIPVFKYTGTAKSGKFYTIETVDDAKEILGADNAKAVELILAGGAKSALVYAVPAAPLEGSLDYDAMLEAFTTQEFNVFVYPDAQTTEVEDKTKAWVINCREKEGKHFLYIAGGTAADDATPTKGNARSVRLADDYVTNLITGIISNGVEIYSGKLAPHIAGIIAATAINKSITYKQITAEDVNKRLKRSEIETALTSGSLVLVFDGVKVKIVQGIVTKSNEAKRGKIRAIRARQAIVTDISKTVEDNYIGKIDNNADGQAALISAVKAYLEVLEGENVLSEATVELNPKYASVGDSVYLLIGYLEVDSMEHVYLTIKA